MKIRLISLFLLLGLTALAQNGNITGRITTSEGKPAGMVTISLLGTNHGTLSDTKGEFTLSNIPPGNYTLVASHVGLANKEQPVSLAAGETKKIDIALHVSATELNEVVISESKTNHFDRKSSEYVAKMPLKNMENPQVYNVISNELLKEQVVTNFDDALKNAPGVEKLWESTGRGGDGAGYYSLRGFEAQATMVNGLPGLTNGSLDPANIDRIEILKGPSGTLFGSSLVSYGGLINTVTKKPFQSFGGEVSYITGSYGLNRITADINVPVNAQAAVRLNTAYHTENSWQDAGFRKSVFVAPSFFYQRNKRLSFLITTEFLQSEGTNPVMLFLNRSSKLQYANLAELNYNPKLSLTSNDITIRNPQFNLQGQMNYNISDKWKSQTVVSRSTAKSDGYYSYLWDNWIDKGEFSLFISDQNSQTHTTDIQQNFIGDFKTAGIRHRVVAGLDYFHRQTTDFSSSYPWLYDVTPQGVINFEDPYSEDVVDPRSLTIQSVDALLENNVRMNYNVKSETYSAYVSDVINIIPSLAVLASARVDYFDNEGDITTNKDDYDQTAISPKFGIVYQPVIDKVSVFANYMNGFRNVAPMQVADADGSNTHVKTFEPENANQFEAGVKTSLLHGRITAMLSYYDILVKNKLMPDAFNINNMVQGGEVESKGGEISIIANPVRGLNLIAGYSYNESTVVKGEKSSSFAEEGRRPAEAGPQHLANAWAVYHFSSGVLNGFGLGFGANAASERMIMDSELTGRFSVPSYTIFNASVHYETENFRVTLKSDNLANEEYYKGWTTINPQKPRSVSAGFSYKF